MPVPKQIVHSLIIGGLFLLPSGAIASEVTLAGGPDEAKVYVADAAKDHTSPEFVEGPELSIVTVPAGRQLRVEGRCARASHAVTIAGGALQNLTATTCKDGKFTALVDRRTEGGGGDIIANQLMPSGSILVARAKAPSEVAGNPAGSKRVNIEAFSQVVRGLRPGDHVRLEPGTYSDVRLGIPKAVSGTPDRPIVIDGQGQVTLTGKSAIRVRGSFVTLTGINFEETGRRSLDITGQGVRVSRSKFDRCGDPQRPKSECIYISEGARNAELDSNVFANSVSMSVKVRAGAEDEVQPENVYIHHNVFRDIERRSGNGQEPIQISGPRGGIADIPLKARVEHNIFYRASGDVEAVSLKTKDNVIRWNVFKDLNAAPTMRGSRNNTVTNNLLVRSLPIRIAGIEPTVTDNVVVCPRTAHGIAIYNGSAMYAAVRNGVFSGNTIVARRGVHVLTPRGELLGRAADNRITDNVLMSGGAMFSAADGQLDEVLSRNKTGPNAQLEKEGILKLCEY